MRAIAGCRYSRAMRWITTALLVGLAMACGSPAPSCRDAITRSAKVLGTPDGDVSMLVSMCEKEGWSEDLRRCIAKASSEQEAGTCIADKLGDDLLKKAGTAEADAEAAAAKARAMADQAMKDAEAAKQTVDKVAHDLDDLNAKINSAIDALASAQNDADRAVARAKLAALQQEQSETKVRVEAAKADADKAQRAKGVHVSKQCMDNPLAKGCT